MGRKILKWVGIVLGGLIGLAVVAALGLWILGGRRVNRTYAVQPPALEIPTDEAALARGEHLVNVACRSCHGADLGGAVMMDEPGIATVYAPNLTPGNGGIGATYNERDLLRAIRHGIDEQGRHLMIMPSESFIHFSAEDLGAIIAYLQNAPPVDNELPERNYGILGRVLLAAGMFGDPFAAEYIDHERPFAPMPEVGANLAYGEYLAAFCTSCHGADLTGGQPPDPASPPAPDLTPGGELAGWTEADFTRAMRAGTTPGGRQLDPAFMPYESFGKFYDEELQALWMYLQDLPAETAAE